MFFNRLGFIALGSACIVAAGIGGYVASRQNAVTPAPVVAAPPASETPAVKETESVVGDAAKKPPVEGEPSAPEPSIARRNATPSRSQAAAAPSKPEKRTATATQARSSEQRPLDRSWPSSATPAPAQPGAVVPSSEQPVQRPEEASAAEAARPSEPPAKTFEELVVASNSVIGLQMESAISSETARVEDRVEARVVRDVRVGGQVAIPAGARAVGSVMAVDRGGKFKERARLGIRFHTLVLADGTRLPITTETIYREGQAPGNGSAAKIGGGAVAGTILGAIIGGAKGAAVGAAAGAGGGTAAVMAGDRSSATFPVGTEVTARLMSPVTVEVEK